MNLLCFAFPFNLLISNCQHFVGRATSHTFQYLGLQKQIAFNLFVLNIIHGKIFDLTILNNWEICYVCYVCYVFIVYCFLELLLIYYKQMCMDPLTCVFEIWNLVKEAIFSLNSLNSIVFHALFCKKKCCYWYPHPSKIFVLVLKLDVVQCWRDYSLH